MAIDTYGQTELAYTIYLDRYALKDTNRLNLNVGDVVVALIRDTNSDTSQRREVATIISLDHLTKKAEVLLAFSEEVKLVSFEHIDRPVELNPAETQKRVAAGIAAVEKPEIRDEIQEQFEWLMADWKFVPGGRIMTAAGTDQELTYANCFAIPVEGDSRGGIMKTLSNMAELMSRGGGVGINTSTLRPKRAYVRGVNGRSSGAVSWGALYSFVTGLIEQGGSRRGALILILNDWHPDIFDFVHSKKKAGQITNANISVGISDAFMERVRNDEDWDLVFPDTSHPQYDAEWDGILEKWQAKGYPVIVYRTIKARELWNAIVESAWASAEPGLWFRERSNKMSNSYYYDSGYLRTTNPCGEIPLPNFGICNLGAINLSKFWDEINGRVNWAKLALTVRAGVRFLDNAIDATPYFLDQTEVQQKSERRVGLGTMGLAELMILAGVRYGSPEGVEFADNVYRFIAAEAYRTSALLAKEKGAFPEFIAEKHLDSGFMLGMPDDVRESVRANGIRNVTLLTIAPTGTTGTMVNTSTGIEPFFSWVFYRKGRLGIFEERVKIVQDWLDRNPGLTEEDLPDYYVTAMTLSPEEHVRMQGAAQRWVDSSISKTVNCPNDWTTEQVSELYMLMYDLGCKGGTIYRDGSRDEQVLNLTKNQAEKGNAKVEIQQVGIPANINTTSANYSAGGYVYEENKPRPTSVTGSTHKLETHWGSMFVTINEFEGQPYEVFILFGKSGSDAQASSEATGRLISLALQEAPLEKRRDVLQKVVDQMRNIGGGQVSGFGPNRITSQPDAIAKVIQERYLNVQSAAPLGIVDSVHVTISYPVVSTVTVGDIPTTVTSVTFPETVEKPLAKRGPTKIRNASTCPACNNLSLVREEGCSKCKVCGHSMC